MVHKRCGLVLGGVSIVVLLGLWLCHSAEWEESALVDASSLPWAQRSMSPVTHVSGAASLQVTDPVTMYLPLALLGYPPPPSIFGVQMSRIAEWHGLSKAVDGGVHWVRYQSFFWDEIEPVVHSPHTYLWNDAADADLRNAYANDLEVIAVVQYAPLWAQARSGSYCGPIRQDRLADFAAFLTALVKRYKDPPYGVKYWELGNEPDAPIVDGRHAFGCWGDPTADYYGGIAYAKMLKAAYPAIKAADPKAQVLIGGLLLDCDPAHPTAGSACESAHFFEGILKAGGGDYLDIVSFHAYVYYDGTLDQDLYQPIWGRRGGMVQGKADFLREVMERYGVDKPLFHTEASLICPEGNLALCQSPDQTFYEKQADYVVRLFVRNWADRFLGTVWYGLEGPGWRHGSLLDENQEPKPAYDALTFLAHELEGAKYLGPVQEYGHLEGYAFETLQARVWVLWSKDEDVTVNIAVPANTSRVLDKYGNELPLSGVRFTGSEPIYVEMPR